MTINRERRPTQPANPAAAPQEGAHVDATGAGFVGGSVTTSAWSGVALAAVDSLGELTSRVGCIRCPRALTGADNCSAGRLHQL